MTESKKQPETIDDDALDAVQGGAQTTDLQRLPVGSIRKVTGDATQTQAPTGKGEALFEGCYKYE
jgi:hypothetical protein